MKQLINKLNEASDAYYNGKELLMSDSEFDLELKFTSKNKNEFKL